VSASGYGEPFAYRPEQRPAMAVDGKPDTAWVVGDRTDPIGEFLTVSHASGTLSLLQPSHTNAASVPSRMITRVELRSGDGRAAEVTLGRASLEGTGQLVKVPGSGPLTITITAVAARPDGTDTGASAVGFAELGLGRHTEIVRTPRLPTDVTATTPLDVVLTRLRVDPMNRWRSDPETSMVRQFTTQGTRDYATTVTLRGDRRAPDAVANLIDGSKGTIASARLTGDLSSRGLFATDGDANTAWTSPFGTANGITLTVPLDGTVVSSLRLRQRVDALHSLITKVRVDIDGVAVDLVVPTPDAQGVSLLQLPAPLVGHTMTIAITGTRPRTTIDRRFAELTDLPVSIRELSAPAIVLSTRLQGDLAGPFCTKGLITLDGADLGVSMTQHDVTALADGGMVQVHTCPERGIRIADGQHRLSTLDGRSTGIDVDRVVLTSGSPMRSVAAQPVAVQRTLDTRTATVAACPSGCWLIFGEGFNVAWHASVHGSSLGPPRQVAGGFNGWWLPPSTTPTVVDISWSLQRSLDWALAASALFIGLCLVLVVRVRRATADSAPDWVSSPPRLTRDGWAPQSLAVSAAAALAIVAVTALIAAPSTALYALVPAVLVVLLRRPRVAAVVAAVLLAALGGRVLQRQLSNRFPANAAWPGFFEKLHRPGMLIVALLLVAALAEWNHRDSP
jgi:arabinofuranan 3-O-arabinosyltransferase